MLDYTVHMSVDRIVDTFPASWRTVAQAWPRQLTVNVAGYVVAVHLTAEDLSRVYLPVLHVLQSATDGALGSPASVRRVVAGLAGVPGAGKSTFAAVLARLADAVLGMGRLIVVGMDGWHWPNAVLDTRTTTDQGGCEVPLRRRKGGPDSFDVEGIICAIRELQSAAGPVSLPIYDRRLHDPVPGGVTIGPGTSIVLMEGNYLLADSPPWDAVSKLLYPRLFIEADAGVARDRVIARHIRGGAVPDEAARKYESNDRLNAMVVLATAANADYTIRSSGVVASLAG